MDGRTGRQCRSGQVTGFKDTPFTCSFNYMLLAHLDRARASGAGRDTNQSEAAPVSPDAPG